MLRRGFRIGCLFAGLVVAITAPTTGHAAPLASDFAILKCDDVTSSSVRLTIIVVNTLASGDRAKVPTFGVFVRAGGETTYRIGMQTQDRSGKSWSDSVGPTSRSVGIDRPSETISLK